MADARGFLKYPRHTPVYRPVPERLHDFRDVVDEASITIGQTQQQAARCMDCGVPFCHQGCPLGNLIPDFNDAVYRQNWEEAFRLLRRTNNFPEFTGRICPAPCENACVLSLHQSPVAIEHIERTIAEMAFEQDWVRPQPPVLRTGRQVAIIGSGPAGLAAADQLNQAGHTVTVFEKDAYPGGLLRYGIPDFKLEKWIIERRIALLAAEGIDFQCNVEIGKVVEGRELLARFDAVLVCTGAAQPRDLDIPGRQLPGIHYAMDYLTQNNRRVTGEASLPAEIPLLATYKHVIVIGGGDTGSDCVGTANRQGARSVAQLQYRMRPPENRPKDVPWPLLPTVLTTSSSHEEGCARSWEVQTSAFVADANGVVKGLLVSDLAWEKNPDTGRYSFQEVPGSARELPCDLALIAIGYQGATPGPLWAQLGLSLDANGLIATENYRTTQPRVFVAGDVRRGQSLVVWAIAEGRAAAATVHGAMIDKGL